MIALNEPAALIADDDPDVGPLVSAALAPFHIHTEAVEHGVDAVIRLRLHRYDLVVLDLSMSDLHGYHVLRTLRQLPLNCSVPVLVLTADGSHEAMYRSFRDGADDFVKKPFDPGEFGLRAQRLIRPFYN